MARARSQEMNKEHLLPSIPSQADLGSCAQGWDSSMQSTNWRRVSMQWMPYPRQALDMRKEKLAGEILEKIKIEAEN